MTALAKVLQKYMQESGRTAGQIAVMSTVPKTTIESWLSGGVQRPRYWLPLVQVAHYLQLGITDTNTILEAAGHPPIEHLFETAKLQNDNEQLKWLAHWQATTEQFVAIPFQTISRDPQFVGRTVLLSNVVEAVQSNVNHPIYCLQGMAGVGKTAIAVELAYRLRSQFRDGVLWARLDQSDPMQILLSFAHAYGQDVSQFTDLDSRGRMVRGLLGTKETLIVLDHVESSALAEPLCPPTGSCAVVITTRQRNLSLVQGGHVVDVMPFDKEEGMALFQVVLGEEDASLTEDAGIFHDIASLVGYHPLALNIIASRLRYEPHWSPTKFLRRLGKQARRLHELTREQLGIAAVLATSFEHLPDEKQHFFTTLAVFSAGDFSAESAADIAGIDLDDAEDWLRSLFGLSLVNAGIPDRYEIHPLIRDFAYAQQTEPNDWQQRFRNHYLTFAQKNHTNYSYLGAEQHHIRLALQMTLDAGEHTNHQQAIIQTAPFWFTQGAYDFAQTHLQHAYGRAKENAYLAYYLGQVAERQGQITQAIEWYEGALTKENAGNDPRLLSMIFQALSWVACQQGDFRKVRHYLAEADKHLQKGVVRLTRRQLMEQQLTLTQSSLAEAIRGYEIAGIQAQTKAIATHRQISLKDDTRWQAAETNLMQGLSLARTIGFADGIGSGLLVALGWLSLFRGEITQAQTYFKEGLQVAQTISHQERISNINLGLGLTALKQTDLPTAQSYLATSQHVAQNIHHQALQIAGTLAQGWVAIHNQDVFEAQQQWEMCRTILADNSQHPMFALVTVGLQMLESGANIQIDFDELEPLIWDILQTTSLTTLPHTIWQ